MEQFVLCGILGFLGASIGSFCGATVWRLRARQLSEDKQAGEKVDSGEFRSLKKLLGVSLSKDRSQCLHCHHTLRWYDLIPVVSWLQLGGKCRYCRKPIGKMEILIELATAALYVVSYIFWPGDLTSAVGVAQFIVWLVLLAGLIILFVYDARWFLLPDRVVFPLLAIAAGSTLFHVISAPDPLAVLIGIAGSCAILSGLYLALFIASKGAWIGFGDIKLGLVLALIVVDWHLAFLTLFLANFIGCLLVIPGLLSRKLTQGSRIPFGPMLIAACIIAVLFGQQILGWYIDLFTI